MSYRDWQYGWRRTRERFWRHMARKVDPYLTQGVHIHGITMENARGVSLSGITVHGHGTGPALLLKGAANPFDENGGKSA